MGHHQSCPAGLSSVTTAPLPESTEPEKTTEALGHYQQGPYGRLPQHDGSDTHLGRIGGEALAG